MARSKHPQKILLIFFRKFSNTRVTINICPPHLLIQYTTQNECKHYPFYISNHHFSSLAMSKHSQNILWIFSSSVIFRDGRPFNQYVTRQKSKNIFQSHILVTPSFSFVYPFAFTHKSLDVFFSGYRLRFFIILYVIYHIMSGQL